MYEPSALNPKLFSRLQRAFGDVEIHNEGEPFVGSSSYSHRPGKLKGTTDCNVLSPGEYYSVNCPFCMDNRHRLWINHRWGTTWMGSPLNWLIHCYNEGCEQMEDFHESFCKLIGGELPPVKVIYPPGTDMTERKVEFPGLSISISELDTNHPILTYLRSRGFSIEDLDRNWGLRWFTDNYYPLIHDTNRLVIPCYDDTDSELKLVAYQTRFYDCEKQLAVPPSKRIPKYLTQGKKSKVVYNLYRARKSDFIVICEGVFDAIRVGVDHGVCTFGKTLSARQIALIEDRFLSRGGRVVFAYDPDVSAKNWYRIQKSISRWPNVKYIHLDDGTDLADYDQETIDTLIQQLKKV
jgi:hypothetical protein